MSTSISGSVRLLAEFCAIPSAKNALPAGTFERIIAVAETRVPFWATTTASPSAIPSREASPGESSTCWRAIRYWSAGEISTSGEAHSGR